MLPQEFCIIKGLAAVWSPLSQGSKMTIMEAGQPPTGHVAIAPLGIVAMRAGPLFTASVRKKTSAFH